MIFAATIKGKEGEEIACRVLDPARRQWWQGVDQWGPDTEALCTPLEQVGEQLFAGDVAYPYPGVTIEYLLRQADGSWRAIGADIIPLAPILPMVTLSEEDRAAIAESVAAGINSSISTPLVVPLVAGAPTTVKLTKGRKFAFKRGDTYRLVFSLGRDCTGWQAFFGGKKSPHQQNYDMPLRQAVFTDQALGTGYVDLIPADTAQPGQIFAELELRRGENETNTPEEYTFTITEDIVKR